MTRFSASRSISKIIHISETDWDYEEKCLGPHIKLTNIEAIVLNCGLIIYLIGWSYSIGESYIIKNLIGFF